MASSDALLFALSMNNCLLREALEAGAVGFSTGRSDNHRTSEGKDTPAANAGNDELTGLAQAFEGLSHGVVQIVSDFNLLNGADQFDAEFDSVEALARASGKPVFVYNLLNLKRTRFEGGVGGGLLGCLLGGPAALAEGTVQQIDFNEVATFVIRALGAKHRVTDGVVAVHGLREFLEPAFGTTEFADGLQTRREVAKDLEHDAAGSEPVTVEKESAEERLAGVFEAGGAFAAAGVELARAEAQAGVEAQFAGDPADGRRRGVRHRGRSGHREVRADGLPEIGAQPVGDRDTRARGRIELRDVVRLDHVRVEPGHHACALRRVLRHREKQLHPDTEVRRP